MLPITSPLSHVPGRPWNSSETSVLSMPRTGWTVSSVSHLTSRFIATIWLIASTRTVQAWDDWTKERESAGILYSCDRNSILRKEQKFVKTSEPIWNLSDTIVGLDEHKLDRTLQCVNLYRKIIYSLRECQNWWKRTRQIRIDENRIYWLGN